MSQSGIIFTDATVSQVGARDPDGTRLGGAITDPIAFYGATPTAQRAAGNNPVLTAAAALTTVAASVIEIRATLVGLGIMPAT